MGRVITEDYLSTYGKIYMGPGLLVHEDCFCVRTQYLRTVE